MAFIKVSGGKIFSASIRTQAFSWIVKKETYAMLLLQSVVCLAVLGLASAGLVPTAYVADHYDHHDHHGDTYVSSKMPDAPWPGIGSEVCSRDYHIVIEVLWHFNLQCDLLPALIPIETLVVTFPCAAVFKPTQIIQAIKNWSDKWRVLRI